MTYFIACLLIYGLELSPVLYVLGFVLWIIHLIIHDEKGKK